MVKIYAPYPGLAPAQVAACSGVTHAPPPSKPPPKTPNKTPLDINPDMITAHKHTQESFCPFSLPLPVTLELRHSRNTLNTGTPSEYRPLSPSVEENSPSASCSSALCCLTCCLLFVVVAAFSASRVAPSRGVAPRCTFAHLRAFSMRARLARAYAGRQPETQGGGQTSPPWRSRRAAPPGKPVIDRDRSIDQ